MMMPIIKKKIIDRQLTPSTDSDCDLATWVFVFDDGVALLWSVSVKLY
jgi:hypothetical protein